MRKFNLGKTIYHLTIHNSQSVSSFDDISIKKNRNPLLNNLTVVMKYSSAKG